MYRKASFLFVSLIAILAVAAVVPGASADEVSHARIVRLSFVEGDVAYQTTGSDWQRAMMNLPIGQDYSVRTDAGYAEVEFETGLVVRLAQNTQIEFSDLRLVDGHRVTSLKLDQGTIIATDKLARGDQFTIEAGTLNVTAPANGRFRIDVTDSQSWVTALHGTAGVTYGSGTKAIENGKTFHYTGGVDAASIESSPVSDAFDKWVADRDKAKRNSQVDASGYVSQRGYAYDVGDLYNYGLWFNMPGYGVVWQPYGLGANWMPFGNGQWMFGDPALGWMWTSFEPWGWLPYHYGGWVNVAGGGWFWVPQNLGTFRGATANFVSVGSQMGWTPTIVPPTNPAKFKGIETGPTQVVFASGATNGVIPAGPRGRLNPGSTLKFAQSPGRSFAQGEPSATALASSGVKLTGHAAVRPVSTAMTFGAHGTITTSGAARASLAAPKTRPTAMAPHSSAAPVVRPPSTFARSNSGGANSGVALARSSGSTATARTSRGASMPNAGAGVNTAGARSKADPIKH